MPINKVDYNGKTLIDLTNDTVTESDLPQGVIAHDASGARVVGSVGEPLKRYKQKIYLNASKGYDNNTFYIFRCSKAVTTIDRMSRITASSMFGAGADGNWFTHELGVTATLDVLQQSSGWGATLQHQIIIDRTSKFVKDNVFPIYIGQDTASSKTIVWFRGGNFYTIETEFECVWEEIEPYITGTSQNIRRYTVDDVPKLPSYASNTYAKVSNAEMDAQNNVIHETYVKKKIPYERVTTNDGIDKFISNLYNSVSDDESFQGALGLGEGNLILTGGGTWHITGFRASAQHGFIEAKAYDGNNPYIRHYQRNLINGVWQPWYHVKYSE